MPSPQANMLTQLSKTNFIGQGIVLPENWQDQGPQYNDAFSPAELSVSPNPAMTLFKSATLNKLHVDTAKGKSDEIASFIEKMCAAICQAINVWMKQATISGVMINGPVGMLTPGCVKAPPITSSILAKAPRQTPLEQKYSQAIASTIGTGWQQWSMGLVGTLQYPLFAAVAAPVAPPSPNVPMPLIAFSSPGEAALSASMLSKTMAGQFADPTAKHSKALFQALAFGFNSAFNLFKTTTLIQNVMGTGPVPSYSPPYVPVGPVMAGSGNGAPGCIM